MADITIPGVSDKYGTTNLIEQLMEVERVPLTREQQRLESYQKEQDAWRSVNKAMSSLRESVRTLYSFDNPFNTKLATSSEEDAITASPSRDAEIGSFKIKVEQIAEEITAMVEYKKENFIQKLLNKIKRLFKK